MTNPVFHHPAEALAGARRGDVVEVHGPEARHAVTVRRLRAGEPVDLVDGAGTRVTGSLLDGEKDRMRVTVEAVTHEPAPAPQLTLVQALAKGDRDLQAVEAATELGVHRVVPWQAERSIVRLRGDRAAKTMAKWESALSAAAKQSRRAHWPALAPWQDTPGLAELVRSEPETLWLVLHESVPTQWSTREAAQWGQWQRIAVLVGPEGGVGEDELQLLRAAGAQPVRLGTTVMRSSTAGPAALAALSAVLGLWDEQAPQPGAS